MWYCSEQCQKLDWKSGHKYTECTVYQICNANKLQDPKRKTFIDYDTPRLLLRLYLYTNYNPKKRYEEHKTFEGKLRSLEWLMEHRADVQDHKDRMLIFNDIKLMFEESNIKYDEELLFRLFCKMYINGFSVMNSMLLEIGRAVFILASQFDHSCVPNAITQFYGKNIEVRTIQEIDTSKQEIFVSYLNVMEKIDKRQETLARGYYFKCQCERCVFELKHYSELESGKIQNEVVCKCPPSELIGGTKSVPIPAEPPAKLVEKSAKEVKKENSKNVKSNDQKTNQQNKKKETVKSKNGKEKETKKSDDKMQVDEITKVDKKEDEEWHLAKKNRNQKGKQNNVKSTTPEPAQSKDLVQIIETKAETESSKPTEDKPLSPDQLSVEGSSAKLRPTTRSPHQTLKTRQNSKSPLPRSKLARSPLPGNRLRLQKSPLPKNRKETKSTDQSAKQTNNSKETTEEKTQSIETKEEDKKVTPSKSVPKPVPEPTRFVPYTDIERECLAKFDDLNKQFTMKVEKKQWLDAYELAKQLYRCYLTYYRDDYSAEITLHLIQMLQIKRNILREKFNLHDAEVADLFGQLGKNILVTHGASHHLIAIRINEQKLIKLRSINLKVSIRT